MCLGLISARDAELAEALGLARNERPRFLDEKPTSHGMTLVPPAKKRWSLWLGNNLSEPVWVAT